MFKHPSIYLLSLVILCTYATSLHSAEEPVFDVVPAPQVEAMVEAKSPAVLMKMYAERIAQLDKIISYAQHIIQLVMNDQIKCNKQVVGPWLHSFLDVCNDLKKRKVDVITLQALIVSSRDIRKVAKTLELALMTNLAELAPLSADMFVERHMIGDVTFEGAVSYMEEVSAQVEELEQKVMGFGSHWYNRAYNNLRNANIKYKIGTRARRAGLCMLAGYAVSFGILKLLEYSQVMKWEYFDRDVMEDIVDDNGKIIKRAKSNPDGSPVPTLARKFREFFFDVRIREPRVELITIGNTKYAVQALEKDNNKNTPTHNYDYMVKDAYGLPCAIPLGLANTLGNLFFAEDQYSKFDSRWRLTEYLHGLKDQVHNSLRGSSLNTSTGARYVRDITLDDTEFDFVRSLLKPFYTILEFLKDAEKFMRTGAKIPKAFFITGGTGEGKSYAVEALVGSINKLREKMGNPSLFNFVPIEPHHLNGWNGNIAKGILSYAQTQAPCVVFFDEMHISSGGAISTTGNTKLFTELLMVLDELDRNNDPDHHIIFIFASNRPEQFAPEFRNRCEEVKFSAASFEERCNILKARTNKAGYRVEDIDFASLGRVTQHCSRRQLAKIFEHALLRAKEENVQLNFEHFYEEINQFIRHQLIGTALTGQEKHMIACYQAGNALAHLLLDLALRLESVTIRGYARPIIEMSEGHLTFQMSAQARQEMIDKSHKPKYGRIYTWSENEYVDIETDLTKRERCKALLAGGTAQRILLGGGTVYRLSDRKKALRLAEEIILKGVALADLSERQQQEVKEKAYELFTACEQEVHELLLAHKEQLIKLVQLLEDKQHVRAEEIKAALGL